MNLILEFLPLFIILYFLILYFSVINHLILNNNLDKTQKTYWLLIILIFPVLGSLYYYKKDR
jgi:hypothetical protein